MDCDGYWIEVPTPDETGDLHAVRCSDCDDLMVVVRGRAHDFPAGTDLESAVREVLATTTRRQR